jgi:hypothetical protein
VFLAVPAEHVRAVERGETAETLVEETKAVKIKDVFEIKEKYNAGHDPGLVVVLDALTARNPEVLAGFIPTVQTPSGEALHLSIDEAEEHGSVNSLFFKGLVREDIPVGSSITIAPERVREPKKATSSPVS